MIHKRFWLTSASFLCFATPAIATETITYTYDVHGRIVEVKHAGGVNANAETDYTYDKADNRQTVDITNSPNPPP